MALAANDREGPWRVLLDTSKPADPGQFWTYRGLKWLRTQKPLCFQMPLGPFDPSSIRVDAKGVPLESNVLAHLREQTKDHLSGFRAMIEILEIEVAKRDKGAGEGGTSEPAKKKKRPRRRKRISGPCPKCESPNTIVTSSPALFRRHKCNKCGNPWRTPKK